MQSKKELFRYRIPGFTLLEILLVLAVMSILAGLIVFTLRPAVLLTDTKKAQRDADKGVLEQAIEAYQAFNTNGEVYPPTLTGLVDGVYDICVYGITGCTGSSVNIDVLVEEGLLVEVPVDPDCESSTDSCYNVKVTNSGTDLSIAADFEVIVCATGYVLVPGNALYGTSDFCVMKFESKNVASVATSVAAGTPWVSITQTAAITACSALGSKYHLITNEEWMTIARNVEQVAGNWTTSTVGSGELYSGHNDSIPNVTLAASIDDNLGYTGTSNSAPSNQRRTLTLSNGGVIWDMAGNAWEWVDDSITCAVATCTTAEMPFDSTPASETIDFNLIATYGQLSYDLIRPSNASWISTTGMGKYSSDLNAASPSGNIHAFMRGGTTGIGNGAGIFTLNITNSPAHSFTTIGYRCTMSN
jgi:prepilin-type N-terminal cleavage/methylation domain-containing protein